MIRVYNQSMQLVAFLENAYGIGYETPLNNLWRASFSLPANDEKNEECLPLRFVELFDGDERIDLFRITPSSAKRSSDGQTVTYECEHVLATLLDDVMFQFHTVGNVGYYTENVIDYVLQRQTVERWQVGTIEFDRQFEYNWENENLLSALYSIPKPIDGEYMWTWDTSSYPWSINLVEPPSGAQSYIRYAFNMHGITKTTDPLDLCTRLYCLGYGEGVNQLTISDINDGLPYLDADTQGQYGIVSKVWADRRFTSAETLMARGQAMLEQLKTPRITYQVDAADLFALTKDSADKFVSGSQVRVIDEELGIDIVARVVNVIKSDITGSPGDVQLEIANRPVDIAGSIAELSDRQRINEVYAQGATNIDSHDFADNCDQTHPAVLRFWVPEEAVRINKVMLTYQSEPFRAFERAIAAAPATSSGPSSTSTTESGGGAVDTDTGVYNFGFGFIPDSVLANGAHNHGITPGMQLALYGGGYVTFAAVADHGHNVPDHGHKINLPPHSHNMPHTHTIPSHSHDIEFGIYEGSKASSVTLIVDGNVISGMGADASNVDIVPYLEKDEEGKIKRGQFHIIEITPDNMSRIVASVTSQLFVQSRGGGGY